MCAAPNLANLTSWHSARPPPENLPIYPPPNDPKSKLSNYRMLVLNNLNKHEERNFGDSHQSKYFLSPLRTFQLTPEECNEILIKRAALVAEASNQNTHSSSDSNSSDFPNAKLRPYSCTECGKTFIQKHHLTTHKKVHTGIRPHACPHCGKAFTHKHCLNTHLLLHSSDRPYHCSECKKSFTLKHHLISHSKVHSREKPFICTECGRAFPLKRHLVTHTKFHAGERPFLCDECGESFAQKDHLVMHSRFHGSINSFECHECSASFTRKFELVNHNRLHGHIPLSCPVCHKEFLQKRTLVAHMRLHTDETPFTCLTCGEGFHIRNELTHHMSAHNHHHHHHQSGSSAQGKLLPCTECGSSFSNPEALALHVKLHSGDASLVNDLCTLTANLPTHNSLKLNHPMYPGVHVKPETSVKTKSHICAFCSKAFSAKHGLQQHNKRHPEGTCALKSHICDVCNKGFYQKNHLLLHQRQHMDPSMRTPSASRAQTPDSTKSGGHTYNDISNSVNDKMLNNNDASKQRVGYYLPPQLDYSPARFGKTTEERLHPQQQQDDHHHHHKNNYLESRMNNYSIANLSNVDLKMQMTGDVIGGGQQQQPPTNEDHTKSKDSSYGGGGGIVERAVV